MGEWPPYCRPTVVRHVTGGNRLLGHWHSYGRMRGGQLVAHGSIEGAGTKLARKVRQNGKFDFSGQSDIRSRRDWSHWKAYGTRIILVQIRGRSTGFDW